jgi:RNA polymerase sigma-70 factor, ECF subfamily
VAVPDQTDDLTLLQRIAVRDDAAMAELYDRHHRLAYAIVRRIVQSPSDAEEVLQEAFVRVWSRADTFDPRLGSPAAWLVRIARNRAIDRLRARQARAGNSGPAPVSESGSPERDLAVRGAVATLPAAQRALIEAAFFEGYTHQELSARFGVPLGTVKTRIRSGLVNLRERLEQPA